VREALQAVGGSKETLYKNIGDTAIYKAAPKLLLCGGLIAASIIFLGKKGVDFVKDRKRKIENEPALKKEFLNAIETEPPIMDEKELTECKEITKS
jgi:hypothetical protein